MFKSRINALKDKMYSLRSNSMANAKEISVVENELQHSEINQINNDLKINDERIELEKKIIYANKKLVKNNNGIIEKAVKENDDLIR